jgi:hypothetical protein
MVFNIVQKHSGFVNTLAATSKDTVRAKRKATDRQLLISNKPVGSAAADPAVILLLRHSATPRAKSLTALFRRSACYRASK